MAVSLSKAVLGVTAALFAATLATLLVLRRSKQSSPSSSYSGLRPLLDDLRLGPAGDERAGGGERNHTEDGARDDRVLENSLVVPATTDEGTWRSSNVGECLSRPLHPSGWGAEVHLAFGVSPPAWFSSLAPCRLRALCAGNGAVCIRLGSSLSAAELKHAVERGLGGRARPPPSPRGWPSLVVPREEEDGRTVVPEVHLLGSPGSGGEFVPAVDGSDSGEEEADSAAAEARWSLSPSLPCSVTDWHVDEPWESSPPRYTVLYAAESEGTILTRLVHTAGSAFRSIPEADRAVLLSSVGVFDPPPWLPLEVGRSAIHRLSKLTEGGQAAYVCADSLASVLCGGGGGGDDDDDDEDSGRAASVALAWRVTRCLTTKAAVASWSWSKHDVIIIDNHSALHARTTYDEKKQKRLLYRLRVEDSELLMSRR